MREVRNQKSEVRVILLLTFIILSFAFGANAQESSGQPTTGAQADLISEFDVNGLKVIVKRRPNAPTVSAGLFIRGGVRNLTPTTAGIESLMLSTATEASKKFPRDVMRKELSKMASALGSGSNEDFSVISLNSTRPNFDKTWDIFTDAIMNPSFTQADFDLVRGKILTALKNQSISPDSALDVLQDKVVYANHPYANDPNGTPETIAAFKLEDIRAYHQKVMTTSQLLLVVVGDVDPDVLQKRVADSLGKLPKGNYKETPLPQITFDKPSLDITSRAVETNYIKGIFAAPSLSNPDYYAMRVAMTLLQSKVINEVRNKRQLSYAPNAEMADDAANTANIYVTANDANQSVSLMLNEIDKMRESGVDEEEFQGLPGYFLTTYFIKQETNASQVAELARYELIGGGWRNSLKFIDNMLAVKPQDVKTVANKYMKNIRFVVIGNPAAINKQVFMPN
ncbi:MAG TPA: pitrilysin family protein [Pyrinomonadaceae bacterium]|nr:pitrilysin family protein [Pyrinomonadaceae bacterium]